MANGNSNPRLLWQYFSGSSILKGYYNCCLSPFSLNLEFQRQDDFLLVPGCKGSFFRSWPVWVRYRLFCLGRLIPKFQITSGQALVIIYCPTCVTPESWWPKLLKVISVSTSTNPSFQLMIHLFDWLERSFLISAECFSLSTLWFRKSFLSLFIHVSLFRNYHGTQSYCWCGNSNLFVFVHVYECGHTCATACGDQRIILVLDCISYSSATGIKHHDQGNV